MVARFRSFISPPVFAGNEEKTRQAGVLNTLLLGSMGILVIAGIAGVLFLFVEKTYNALALLIMFAIAAFARWLMNRGRVTTASIIFNVFVWAVFTLMIPFSGGVNSTLIVFYVIGTVMAGLLLGRRGALIQVLACCAAILAMVLLQINGVTFPRLFPVKPLVAWLDISFALLLVMLAVDIVVRSLNDSLALTRRKMEEQKHAELQLRDNEAKFRNLFETSRDFQYITTLNGNIVDFNKAAVDISGYSPEELRTTRIQNLYDDPSLREVMLKQVLEQGYVENFEIKGRKKDGTLLDTLVNAIAVKDRAGQIIGLQGSIKDISERKRSEEALRASEEKFRRLFETSRDFLYIASEDGQIIDFNKAATTLSGYTIDEIRRINIDDMFYDAREGETLVAKIVEQGFVENYEIKGRKKDGTPVDTLVNSTAIKDESGKVLAFQGSIKDITEIKQAQEALKDSERRFRAIIENSNDAITLVDHDGIGLYVSPSYERVTGYRPDDRLGRDALDTIHPDDQEKVVQVWRRILQEPGTLNIPPFRSRNADGSWHWFEGVMQNLLDEPSVASLVINFRDISERKQAEEALQESEERFRNLSQLTTEGIMVHENNVIMDANQTFADLVGYPDPAMLRGKNGLETVPLTNESRQLVRAKAQIQYLEPFEIELVRPDGSRLPAETSSRDISFRGRPARLVSMRDITERKQAELKIARQVERLRALNSIEQAILSSMDLNRVLSLLVQEVVKQLHVDAVDFLLYDPETQRLNFTSGDGFRTQALRFTSLPIGKGLAGQAAENRKTLHEADLSRVTDNPTLSQSIGGEGFVAYYAVPLIAKEQLLGILEIFHRTSFTADPDWLAFLDSMAGQAAISIDNARLLEKTQQSLNETNALYQVNKDLVASIEADRLMNNVVDLLQKNFDYHYAQIFTTDPATGDFVMRAGSGSIGKKLKKRGHRLAAGVGIVGFTAETGTPFFSNNVDDVLFYVRDPLLPEVKSELAVPIRTNGEVLGLLDIHQVPPAHLTQRDVNLVSAVADQLAMSLQKARLYADLQEALRQEQATRSQLIHNEKLAIAGRLLASVSHELNNPLQAIQNALYLLKDEISISSQGRQDLNIVLAETERMATMLERLSTTYRPYHEEDFRLLQVNDIIKDVFALLSTHLRHHKVTADFHADPGLPMVPGRPGQLKQVILNLFMNAVEAMKNGGCLDVATTWLPEANDIAITVKDTGPGIDPSILPNIFEAFVTNKEGGTGLGLAIADDIINKHKGRIQVENSADGGALFTVHLPGEVKEKK